MRGNVNVNQAVTTPSLNNLSLPLKWCSLHGVSLLQNWIKIHCMTYKRLTNKHEMTNVNYENELLIYKLNNALKVLLSDRIGIG